MKKIILGFTTVAAIAAPIAAVVACGDDGTYNGPVVMKEYLKANTGAKEIRVLGHKQELSQQFGWENIGGAQDYMATLLTRLTTQGQEPVLFNVENAASLKKVDGHVEDIANGSYNSTTQPELVKLKASLLALTNKNSHTTLGGNSLPAWLENFGLIYNKDKMTAAGITFESIATAGTNGFVETGNTAKLDQKKLNKAGLDKLFVYLKAHKNTAHVETVMRYPGKSGSEWVFLSHLLGASVGYASNAAPTTVPSFQTGIDMLKNFVGLSGGGTQVASRTADQQVGEFAAGKSFMIQQGSWMESSILNTNPGIHLGMLPLVFGTDLKSAMTTSQWWVINSGATPEEKEQAAKMLNYLYFTKIGQQMMATAGIVPSADLKDGVIAKNKVEDAAKIYATTYESAHTQFPQFFNNSNPALSNAYRALVRGGQDSVFIAAANTAWAKTKK